MKTWALLALLVIGALAGCTSDEGGNTDTDKDGLADSDEEAGWLITVETPNETFEKEVHSDPTLRDTDGDGVDDLFEFALGLDPRDADTDDDGLTDCQEVFHTVLEDCQNPDFDGEGDGGYGTSGSLYDSDAAPSRYVNNHPDLFSHRLRSPDGVVGRGDGLSDGDEIHGTTIDLPGNRTRFVQTDPLRVDTDRDFLEDAEEILVYGTDPTVYDMDGDGCEDGFDPFPYEEERYLIGLESMTWTESGRSGSIDVLFLMSIVDQQVFLPEDDVVSLEHGEPKDLAGLSEDPVRYLDCTYEISDPWVRIDIQVVEVDHGPMDVQSQTVPDGAFSVWWHVQDDRFRWDPDVGPDLDADVALHWSGADGSVAFRPVVEFT